MHEYFLIKSIVQTVNKAAEEHKAGKIKAVFLVAGENRCFIPDSAQMYFDTLAKGTAAEGAVLRVRVVKAEMHCAGCGKNFIRQSFSFNCPVCGSPGGPADTGDEFYIERIEAEV